jgi:hypothetical protein
MHSGVCRLRHAAAQVDAAITHIVKHAVKQKPRRCAHGRLLRAGQRVHGHDLGHDIHDICAEQQRLGNAADGNRNAVVVVANEPCKLVLAANQRLEHLGFSAITCHETHEHTHIRYNRTPQRRAGINTFTPHV